MGLWDRHLQVFELVMPILLAPEVFLHLVGGDVDLLLHHLLDGPGLSNDGNLILALHLFKSSEFEIIIPELN